MNKIICLLLIILSGFAGRLYGQETDIINDMAGERIYVSASSATVLEWFDRIEKETGITLSYNPSMIELDRQCRVPLTGNITVGRLLGIVLADYKYKISSIAPKKLVISIVRRKNFYISGSVSDADSREKLYGAVIMLEDSVGQKIYSMADENGMFKMFVPEGPYKVHISYMGYEPFDKYVKVDRERFVRSYLKPLLFEIDEVTVKSFRRGDELDELSPANMLAFSSKDLFSQIWILPGVTGVPAGNNFNVDGGGGDENQILLDGVPIYHPGHMNMQFPAFNGDAVKSMIFHKGFFPTKFAGRISSVTEVNLKDGNMQEHSRNLTLDMPAASAMFEGPIVKDKLSYVVSGRRSWLDFFDDLLSSDNRMNHSTYDYNAKLTYAISPRTSLKAFAYGARDDYRLPDDNGNKYSVLVWDNQAYRLSFNTMFGKFGNTTSVYYTAYSNRAKAGDLGINSDEHIGNGISSLTASTEFTYVADNIYNARFGVKYSHDIYDFSQIETALADDGHESYSEEEWDDTFPDDGFEMPQDRIVRKREHINQFSIFYDNNIRITDNLHTQVGVHFVGYLPKGHKDYYSIQPRFSLRYTPTENNLFYFNFSKMEQFYHYLRFSTISLPTDFRMPSIGSYKPRESEHYEIGWKHFLRSGFAEVSLYYKTRRNVLAIKPETFIEDTSWDNYLMSGNGESYGLKMYYFGDWKKWSLQASYTYSRSKEWFALLEDRGKMPSFYDIPHQLGCALSYKLNRNSTFSAGIIMNSGKVIEITDDWDLVSTDNFRKGREKMNYRVDAGYVYRKSFGDNLLLLRLGLYNVVGNPSEEDILNFYSVHWYNHCLPYAGISFKF